MTIFSFQDVAPPVIDRAVKIAMTTCEQLVKKDFALDHNENRLRQASHHMVRNLTAGMAMITCKDHLHQVPLFTSHVARSSEAN